MRRISAHDSTPEGPRLDACPGREVSRRAIASSHAFHEELRMASMVMTTSEEVGQNAPAFLEWMTVNLIRPELTEYEAQDATG